MWPMLNLVSRCVTFQNVAVYISTSNENEQCFQRWLLFTENYGKHEKRTCTDNKLCNTIIFLILWTLIAILVLQRIRVKKIIIAHWALFFFLLKKHSVSRVGWLGVKKKKEKQIAYFACSLLLVLAIFGYNFLCFCWLPILSLLSEVTVCMMVARMIRNMYWMNPRFDSFWKIALFF